MIATRTRAVPTPVVLACLLALAACSPKGLPEARSALRTNDLETARELLEADRERVSGWPPLR
jgi:hypothetical protein